MGLFACCKIAPLAGLHMVKRKVTNSEAHQAQGREADRRGHAAYLAIAAFRQRELQPGNRNVLAESYRWIAGRQSRFSDELCFAGSGDMPLNRYSFRQLLRRLFGDDAFHLYPIGARMFKTRIGETVLQWTIVGQKQ